MNKILKLFLAVIFVNIFIMTAKSQENYTITAQNSDTATATGDVGGTAVTATRNMLFDVIHPVVGTVIPPLTTLTAQMRKTGGRTLEGTESEYTLDSTSKKTSVTLNQDYYMTSPGMVASAINETNEMSGSKSFVLECATVTVQDSLINNCAIGFPTILDLPTTTAFFPASSIFKPFNIRRHP